MSDPDPIGRDLGREHARRRLPAGAACVLCGEQDEETLSSRARGETGVSVLELHHIAGAANDEETVVLCLNCHRRMSARMPGYGVDLRWRDRAPGPERLVPVLRGLAVFFEQLAAAMVRWAHDLASGIGD